MTESLQQEILNSEEQRAYNETLRDLLENNQENLDFFPYLQEMNNSSDLNKLDLYIEMLKNTENFDDSQFFVFPAPR